jgi:alkylhydroperoxidase family enzyme
VTRALSDIIPNPSTRAFLGRVYRQWGVEWAAALTGALAAGDLIDCGDASAGEQPAALPASSGAPSGREQAVQVRLW